jgi:hypothetical protein
MCLRPTSSAQEFMNPSRGGRENRLRVERGEPIQKEHTLSIQSHWPKTKLEILLRSISGLTNHST